MAVKPEELLYTETHEWVRLENSGSDRVATVGITDFAVRQLTDLVFMELPSPGTHVAAGEEFGEVESVKAVSPLYCPVGGEVVEANTDLPNHLETLSHDPFGQGWMVKIRLESENDLQRLMDYQAYQKQCAEAG